MEPKITGLPPIAVEQLVRQDQGTKEPNAVKKVPKAEGSTTKKVDKDTKKISEDEKDSNKSSVQGAGQEKTEDLVQDIQKYLEDVNINLNFEIDKKADTIVVKVLNAKTGDLIRQIPPEELLKLREKLRELRGVLYDGKM